MIVVDASVWVSHLIEQDVNHVASRRWLVKTIDQGAGIAAPGLLLAEVAGAVARRTGHPRLGHHAAEHISSTPGLRLVPGEPELAVAAAALAADLQLRGPDAIYVAVAQHLAIPLVTWDKEQLERSAGVVKTLTPEQALVNHE